MIMVSLFSHCTLHFTHINQFLVSGCLSTVWSPSGLTLPQLDIVCTPPSLPPFNSAVHPSLPTFCHSSTAGLAPTLQPHVGFSGTLHLCTQKSYAVLILPVTWEMMSNRLPPGQCAQPKSRALRTARRRQRVVALQRHLVGEARGWCVERSGTKPAGTVSHVLLWGVMSQSFGCRQQRDMMS